MYKGIEFSYPFFDMKGEVLYFREGDLEQLGIHSIVSDTAADETKDRLVVIVQGSPYFYRGDPFFMANKIRAAKGLCELPE